VLNITTILPGQEPDRRFSIPSRRTTASVGQVDSPRSTNAPTPTAGQGEAEQLRQQDVKPLADAGEHKGEALGGAVEKTAMQPAEAPETVRRMDSETNAVDVFQDAQS
jgi:hypothetical protein